MGVRTVLPPWTRHYQRAWLRGDLLAGITVTAYLIPQVMAYADLAGLPAATGLWASVGALAVYALFGTSRQLSVGAEATTALMTAAALGSIAGAAGHEGDFAAALALVVAVMCLIGWLGHLSGLAQLLSRPVLVGYMAGIAAIMIVSQVGKLTRVTVEADGFLPELIYAGRRLDAVHVPTLAVGLVTLGVMLTGSKLWPRSPMALIGMVGATIAVAALGLRDHGVLVIGEIPAGFPVPGLPDVSISATVALIPPALGVAFVAYTDNILTARSFAQRHGDRIDDQRELLALSAANLGSALMHGFPVSSSGSRTAIADAVGARSQLASLFTVLVTVLSVLTLRPFLAAFPSAALGAVVVYAAVRLVDIAEFRRIASFRRSELILALGTTVAVLVVGVLPGVLAAIGFSILDLLRRVARPHDAVEGYVPGIAGMHNVDDFPEAVLVPGLMVYRYDSPLFFANAEDFSTRALRAVSESKLPIAWFVLNTEAIVEVDITAVDVLESLRLQLEAKGIVFALARVKQDLRKELRPSGLLDRVGEELIFPTLPMAVAAFHAWRNRPPPESPD